MLFSGEPFETPSRKPRQSHRVDLYKHRSVLKQEDRPAVPLQAQSAEKNIRAPIKKIKQAKRFDFHKSSFYFSYSFFTEPDTLLKRIVVFRQFFKPNAGFDNSKVRVDEKSVFF